MKDDIMLTLEQTQIGKKELWVNSIRSSLIAGQLAELYKFVYFADEESLNFRSPCNPFWNLKTKRPNSEIELYEAAFMVKNLYVDLKEKLEDLGFVVKVENNTIFKQDISINPLIKESIHLGYFPGTSYVFVPRKNPPETHN